MLQKKIKTVLIVEGMSCKHCANKVESSFQKMAFVKKVRVNLKEGKVLLVGDESLDKNFLKQQIEDLGYQLIRIEEVI